MAAAAEVLCQLTCAQAARGKIEVYYVAGARVGLVDIGAYVMIAHMR